MQTFTKYHGLGNDFIVLNRLQGGEPLSSERVAQATARMQVQNADGSESDMCGNGLRCVARYLYDAKLTPAQNTQIILRAGQRNYPCTRVDASHFRIDMGTPIWTHAHLPAHVEPGELITLEAEGQSFTGTCVFLGNPHFVIFLQQGDALALAQRYGSALEHHPYFAKRTNVSFVTPEPSGFRAVVHERGAGITQACGSGACAVGVCAVRRGLWPEGSPMTVRLLGGPLTIRVDAGSHNIHMEGEAQFVFAGEVP
jgi:diaminopimelate epimerase